MKPSHEPLFLGAAGENAPLLERLLGSIVRDHARWRGVPPSARVSHAPSLQLELQRLLHELHGSIPFSSPRYLAHMTGDATLPSLLGYVAALLHNPNNISSEASPVTTRLELEIGADLARMLGYPAGRHWTHLTSGGTVANAEALWVARSLKYLPLSLRWAAEELGQTLFEVELADGTRCSLRDATLWQLLNVPASAALDAADRLMRRVGEDVASATVARWSLGSIGDQGFGRKLKESFDEVLEPAVLLVPGTAHYSWDKVARMTGIGSAQVLRVPVDSHFRMSTFALSEALATLRRAHRPVLGVVAVIGSTEEGAVDPVAELAELKAELAAREGMSFHLHADAAFGGYATAATWRRDGTRAGPSETSWPTAHVTQSLIALERTDSVTVDPHKLGFAPYPAGAVSFRDGRAKVLCASDAPYVFHRTADENAALGRFTFEGSRPGAAAAALALSHRVLPLHEEGHGALVASCVEGARALRRTLAESAWAPFRLVLLPESDLNLLGFCFAHPSFGSLAQANALVDRLHRRYSAPATKAPPYYVSRTVLRTSEYGRSLAPIVNALGFTTAAADEVGGVNVIRCTVMHPMSTTLEATMAEFANHLAASVHDELRVELGSRAS